MVSRDSRQRENAYARGSRSTRIARSRNDRRVLDGDVTRVARVSRGRDTEGRTRRVRERRRGNVSGGTREGSAREFAGRLKHGSTVSRPPHPKLDSSSSNESAVLRRLPLGDGGWWVRVVRGGWKRRGERGAAPAPGGRAEESTRFALATCHTPHSRSATRAKRIVDRASTRRR